MFCMLRMRAGARVLGYTSKYLLLSQAHQAPERLNFNSFDVVFAIFLNLKNFFLFAEKEIPA